MDWTADDQGIYMADLVVGELNILHGEVAITSYVADADALLASLVPDGQWVWMADNRIFTGSLLHRVQSYHYQQYLSRRETERIHKNTPSRWTQFSSGQMFILTNAKKRWSARTRGWLVNHLFNWIAHEANLAKGSQHGKAAALCPLCGCAATQAHINTTCSHPALQDLRLLHRRDIDHLLLCLQHTVLPASDRWVSLLVRYVEDHMWEDSERAEDLWNGRWTRHILEDILLEHSDSHIPLAEYTRALDWLTQLILLLQTAQTALYSVRRQILRQSTTDTSHYEGHDGKLRDPARRRYSRHGTYVTLEAQTPPSVRCAIYTEVTLLHKSHHYVKQPWDIEWRMLPTAPEIHWNRPPRFDDERLPASNDEGQRLLRGKTTEQRN